MIVRHGPQTWENIHVTEKTHLADLISIDNSQLAAGPDPTGFDALKQSATDLDALIQEARQKEQRIRALGSGWALSDIAITDGWLVNTKALNGCFDVSDKYFDSLYGEEKRPNLVIAQCGISMGELNVHLELAEHSGYRRALKTAGIGAGQTVAGAFSGNTHGAAVKFGSTPDFVVGIQLVTGTGTSHWIERETYPVLNGQFVERIGASLLRSDDVFNAALVSFGSFGIITAVAIETLDIYHLNFRPVSNVNHTRINQTMRELAQLAKDDPDGPYHYEFVFNPFDKSKTALEAVATKEVFDRDRPSPKQPVWIVRDREGFATGDRATRFFLDLPIVRAKWKASIQYRLYGKRAILDNIRATPGQLFTATISYFEGFTESAIAVSINDVPKMLEIASKVVQSLNLPAISQVRVVHPTEALLGFTSHSPKTVIFEFGLPTGETFARFEKILTAELKAAAVAYTFHWSKNSGLDRAAVLHMYGADRTATWRAARDRVFNNDDLLKKVFENHHLVRSGLA